MEIYLRPWKTPSNGLGHTSARSVIYGS